MSDPRFGNAGVICFAVIILVLLVYLWWTNSL